MTIPDDIARDDPRRSAKMIVWAIGSLSLLLVGVGFLGTALVLIVKWAYLRVVELNGTGTSSLYITGAMLIGALLIALLVNKLAPKIFPKRKDD